MAQGDFFSKTEAAVQSGNNMIVDGSTSATGAVEIHTVATSGGADVFKEIDTTGNGTYDVSITVSSEAETIHSQQNKIEVSNTDNMRLRINNTSGAEIDAHVTGIEVNN
jgi:hypothetical protein